MPELIQTFRAMQKTEDEKRRFLASLQGVDLNESTEKEGPTFEDIQRRAMGVDVGQDDVVSLQGNTALSEGFGIGMGLGYSRGIE